MIGQLLHERFAMRNDQLSFAKGYWYVKAKGSIVPIANLDNSIHKRPEYLRRGK